MRDVRYCEVLLISTSTGTPVASVYNSYPLNDCPESRWSALDAKALATQNGVAAAVLNGPRHWMINAVAKNSDGRPMVKLDFGGIEMYEQATVPIGSIAEQAVPYTPHPVNRSATFTYSAGTEIFRLTAPDGSVYVMQSFSQQKDPSLDLAALPSLASRLNLPNGWSYDSQVLADDLRIVTIDTPAQVLQDDLANSYSLIPTSNRN